MRLYLTKIKRKSRIKKMKKDKYECAKIKSKGVDLSKIKIVEEKKNHKYGSISKSLLDEYDTVRKKLINSGADLSKIKIIKAAN